MPELKNIEVCARTEWATAEYVPDEEILREGPIMITFTQIGQIVSDFRLPPDSELVAIEFELGVDGNCVYMEDGAGKVCNTTLTTCDCPDAQINGGSYIIGERSRRCKHMVAVTLHTVYPRCGGTMDLQGVNGHSYFECRNGECGWTVDAALVVESRKVRRQADRQAA